MKRLLCSLTLLVLCLGLAMAKGGAEIKFDKTSHDFGKFTEDNAVVSYTFTFTNVGDGPLVIHQAVASCGCTVPDYTQEPVLPGQSSAALQRHGTHPGALQEVHHPAHQRQDRDAAPLHRRRDGTGPRTTSNLYLIQTPNQ